MYRMAKVESSSSMMSDGIVKDCVAEVLDDESGV